MKYREMTAEQRKAEFEKVSAEFEAWKAKGLKLNMARGRPGKEQLDLVSDILSVMTDPADCVDGDVNVRNYGQLSGLPSAKALFAEILGCKPEQVFVGGNASLQLMYDTIAKAYTNGLLHSEKPWCREEHIKWLCPAPGYDRHFKVTESFGFELITIPMTETGPNMDLVEQLVKDPAVKGMWNVPKYSNPDGIIYSDETIERIARLKPAAPDFLLMWDNAYCIHEFEGEFVPFPDILSLCEKYGNADMVFEFASTSKITLPGAGVACFACSEANMEYMEKLINVQIISYDKINQLRHVKYLKDKAHTLELMKKHAAIMGPKFKAVTETLDARGRSARFRHLARPQGRLLRVRQHAAGPRQAHAGAVQGGGRHYDECGRDLPLRCRPEGQQHPRRSVPPAGGGAAAGDGGLLLLPEARRTRTAEVRTKRKETERRSVSFLRKSENWVLTSRPILV